MIKNLLLFSGIFLLTMTSCKKTDQDTNISIEVNPASVTFRGEGGNLTLNVSMTGNKWTVTSDQTWCTTQISSSTINNVQLRISAGANPTGNPRSAKLEFIVDSKESAAVTVTQESYYPDYSSPVNPDAAGMEITAREIASQIFAGWNLGNSLEVPGGETGWGNPLTTQALIDSVKAAGINAVRIPCSFNSHIEDLSTCKISEAWLQRVKEVVDYCYANNMYVILNIHWDGGWLEENPTYAKQVSVNAKQKAFWEQIAVFFRNYDYHLLFAGTNEVHASADPTAENFEVQMSYNQTFVNAVRSTGGRNAYRTLVVQAFSTNIDLAVSHLVVSTDETADRLMVEVHYYDPWEFAGLEADASWATVKYLWGIDYARFGPISSWGQEDWVLSQFQKMKSSFVDKGYPVILGEFSATRRSALTGSTLENHLSSRAYYYKYISMLAKASGMVPFVWDNGSMENLGCGIFNRNDGTVFDRQVLEAYIEGTTAGIYPF